jgi:hypothetical protein
MKMMWSAMSRAKHLADDAPGIAVPSVGSRCGEQRSLHAQNAKDR